MMKLTDLSSDQRASIPISIDEGKILESIKLLLVNQRLPNKEAGFNLRLYDCRVLLVRE